MACFYYYQNQWITLHYLQTDFMKPVYEDGRTKETFETNREKHRMWF